MSILSFGTYRITVITAQIQFLSNKLVPSGSGKVRTDYRVLAALAQKLGTDP